MSRRHVVVGGLCSAAAVLSGRLSALAQEAATPADDVSAPGRQFLAEHAAVDMHAHPGRFFLADTAMLDASLRPLAFTVVPETLAGMRRGMIAAAVFNTVADLRTLTLVPPGAMVSARTFAAGQAYDDHRAQVAAFARLTASGALRQVLTAADIEAARRAGVVGGILGSEGADFLEGRLDRLAEARRDGVRVIGLVHYRSNELGDVQTVAEASRGLTAFGESVVREMNRLGIVIDLAHAAPGVLRKAAAISTAPVIVSHVKIAAGGGQNGRTLDPVDARRIAEAGGVIGAWPAGIGIATFDEFIDEILRYVDLLGVAHVGLGTDMDANYKPVVTDYGDLPRIPGTLLRRGMRPGEVAQVIGGNFQRVFSAVCGK